MHARGEVAVLLHQRVSLVPGDHKMQPVALRLDDLRHAVPEAGGQAIPFLAGVLVAAQRHVPALDLRRIEGLEIARLVENAPLAHGQDDRLPAVSAAEAMMFEKGSLRFAVGNRQPLAVDRFADLLDVGQQGAAHAGVGVVWVDGQLGDVDVITERLWLAPNEDLGFCADSPVHFGDERDAVAAAQQVGQVDGAHFNAGPGAADQPSLEERQIAIFRWRRFAGGQAARPGGDGRVVQGGDAGCVGQRGLSHGDLRHALVPLCATLSDQ